MNGSTSLPQDLVPDLAPPAASTPAPAPPRRMGWLWLGALLLIAGSGGAALVFHQRWLAGTVTISGLRAGGVDVGGVAFTSLPERLKDIGARRLAQPIELQLGERRVRVPRSAAGLQVDLEVFAAAVRAAGRSGDPIADIRLRQQARRGQMDLPVPLVLERSRAIEFLDTLKELLDHAPVDAHFDLDHHTIAEERPGVLVDVYASLARLEEAVVMGADKVELAAVKLPPRVLRKDLAGIDVSTVVGSWETHYSTNRVDSDRTYNLKVGADHLEGHVLKPHELFSFNEVVGDRTEKEGYRVAPVIAGGELVDGLAGGMCQIASTLHAAAFFAGLEIVSSRPHSRPSAYIPLGLDSTVVYPSVDLKLRNPYDFPIVIHYQVHQGKVKVELLGKERPRQVVFEREILQETNFGTAHRRDPEAPQGQKLVLQAGYPGYHIIRRRYQLDRSQTLPRHLGGPTESVEAALRRANVKPLQAEKWNLSYPSTEEIVAIGSGSPKLKKKPPPPSHRIPPVPPSDKPIGRIVR